MIAYSGVKVCTRKAFLICDVLLIAYMQLLWKLLLNTNPHMLLILNTWMSLVSYIFDSALVMVLDVLIVQVPAFNDSLDLTGSDGLNTPPDEDSVSLEPPLSKEEYEERLRQIACRCDEHLVRTRVFWLSRD